MASKLNHFFNFISVIAVAAIAIPITYMLLGGSGIPHGSFYIPVLTFGVVVFGYFVQHGMASLLGQRTSRDGLASRKTGTMNGFRISYAILPILIIIALGFLVRFSFDRYLYSLYVNNIIEHYEQLSAYPYMAMFLFILSAMSGIIIWFYPMERLSNIYIMIVGIALFMIEFALTFTAYFDSTVRTLVGGCFAVFVSCMMLIYNQSNLQKTYQGSVVSIITPSSRFYNILLVLILLVCLLLAFGLSYVILSGVFLLLRALFYLILYKMFYGYVAPNENLTPYDYVDMEEQALKFNREVMDANSQYMIAMFLTLAFLVIVAIIGIRTGALQKIFRYLYNIIADFFSTISIGTELIKDIDPFDNVYNYKDQKKKLQRASINDYIKMAEQTDNYRAFMQRLAKMPDYEAQISYAYAMLVTVCKKSNVNLKNSDTPREIQSKVTHMIAEDEISEITRNFEAVKYAEFELSPTEASSILNKICAIIKRYIF